MDVCQSYEVPFSTAEVFAAWVSPATVISPATAMDIDPVVGGHYRLIMAMDEGTAIADGRFLKVDPKKNLRYTWQWNDDGEVSVIDVTFTATSTGARIDIYHSGFSKIQSVDSHAEGWDSYIDGLTEFLAR